MKRVFCALLSLVAALSGLSFTAGAQASGKLNGETSRTVRQLYRGVELTEYVLGSSSKYRLQEFSTVEFDPAQDDLYFDVTCGGDWANKLVTTTKTVERFNAQNGEGKTALAAINGDMWLMTSTHSRVEGSGTSYMGYSDPVVTKGLTIPRGFSMYDGEIICTTNMVQETPYNGTFQSFGITAEGEAILGDIICGISIRNRNSGEKISADGINRLPANDALVMYTDKGYASNYSLADAYEVVIDCSYDYVVRQGASINGTVTAIVKPGEEKFPMAANRIILTARGDRISRLAGFKAGDNVSISVTVADNMGNTKKWQSVTNCVGGHMPIVIDGVSSEMADSTAYPTSILGIKADGKVVMLTSYGRQGSVGYSYGFRISQLDELCADLGIVTAFLLDGGGSAAMAVTTADGYELTGRPCDKNSNGSYGRERSVVNAIILSYGEPKSGGEARVFDFEHNSSTGFASYSNGVSTSSVGYSLAVWSTGKVDPNIQFSYLGADAAKYNYLTITARTTGGLSQDMKLGIFVEVGDSYSTVNTVYKQVKFDSTGEWQTLVIRLSDIDAWYGRIYGLKISLFDGQEPVRGEGLNIQSIRMFESKVDADAYAADNSVLGELLRGDANCDGRINLKDVSNIIRRSAGWQVETDTGAADYNADGEVNLRDARAIILLLA